MVVFKGTGFYHVEAANTNRQVDIQVVAPSGQSDVFLFLKGNNAFHPWIGQISAPTVNQKIAQYRADYVVRYLSIYAIPVAVRIASVVVGGAETNNALIITYETAVSNVFPVTSGTTLTEPIADLLGKADRTAKTKIGLQALADSCVANASLDGTSKLFAVNPFLSDGTATTAAVVGVAPSTLAVTCLTPSMY